MAVIAGEDTEAPAAEVDHEAVGPMLRNMEVAGATRAGGQSSSASSRYTQPSARASVSNHTICLRRISEP